MKTEKHLQNYIKKMCQENTIGFYKIHCEGRTGFPDLLLVHNGHTVFIEVKSPSGSGVVSARQIITIDNLRTKGAETYVCDNETKAELIVKDLANREPRGSNRQALRMR